MRTVLPVFLLSIVSVFCQEPRLGPAPHLPQAPSKSTDVSRFAASPSAIPATWYDLSTRAASQLAYLTDYVPTSGVAMGFTGNVSTGNAGDTSAAWKQATINRVNYYRAMAGVPANIVLDSTLNTKAQYGALMMAANGQISHAPPTSWLFYTADGGATLGKSNVCQGVFSASLPGYPTDPGCVAQYIGDQGPEGTPGAPGNELVGHRRWMLYSRQTRIGTGDVPTVFNSSFNLSWNALYVLDTPSFLASSPATRDGFIAWPPKGYVPYQVVPPRWSFGLTNTAADLSAAVVKVTKNSVTTTQQLSHYLTGYGDNTVVFNPDNRPVGNTDPIAGPAPLSDTTYTVSVENVKIGGVVQPAYVYSVTVFDPAITPTSPCTPSVTNYTATSGYQEVPINITGPSCTSWTANANASWAGIYPSTGTSAGSTTVTIYPNFTSSTRTTTALIGGVPVTISQPSIGGTADERFVGQLYYYMLGRLASTSEISGQVALLPTLGRAGLANTFLNSAEFAAKSRYIAGLYVGLLNRDAEFAGWQFQRNALLNGFGATSLVTNFLGSPEYSIQHPNQTADDFVRTLYRQVLLRTPTEPEVASQVAALAGWNRTAMASAFLGGPEFQNGTGPRLLAFLFYATLLNRDPTPTELAALVTSLTGVNEPQRVALLNALLTSPEFLSRLQ